MTFPDWITIVSILIAVAFAVIKYDEMQIIRLKRASLYFAIPFFVLMLSGVAAYFNTNAHPVWLDCFWPIHGWTLPVAFWPIVWIIAFLAVTAIFWNLFVNQSPSDKLLDLYEDLLEGQAPDKFSTLFRKYERFFFTGIRSDVWLRYERIFQSAKFWTVAPVHFKEVLNDMMQNHPDRFTRMDRSVMTTILRVQLGSNDTHMMHELENAAVQREQTPFLNFFLGSAESIEAFRSKNVLIPTVRDTATEYLQSAKFLYEDRGLMVLKPVDGLAEIPSNKLMVFYYINFINLYWLQVIRTKAPVAGFYQYNFWADHILKQAPAISADLVVEGGGQPNHYLQAVNQMMRNVHDWVTALEDGELDQEEDEENDQPEQNGNNDGALDSDLRWAGEHFLKLELRILRTISDHHMEKVIRRWYISELADFMKDLVKMRTLYERAFQAGTILRDIHLPDEIVLAAFEQFTDDDYPGPEQDTDTYRWISGVMGAWRAG